MKKEQFSSNLGAVLAMAGSAVGLGNMWRFPYMVGANGGGAFLLLYIIFVLLLCLPIFFAEFVLGRHTRANAYGAFTRESRSAVWKIAGALTIITPALIMFYYSVVGGWSLRYLLGSVCGEIGRDESGAGLFDVFVGSVWGPLIGHTAFLGITAVIVLGGIKNGIERFSKIMMPLLFVLTALMAVRTITLPGAGQGLTWLFKPDFSAINFSTCAAALGQAFFSLSLGYGIMITYASYVRKDENIAKASFEISMMDLLFSLIVSCAIIPAVFVFGVDPHAGPGLVFQTLPHIFSKMPLGQVVAVIFFVSLLVAALTSSVSIYEVGVAFLVEERNCSRRKATAIIFALVWVAGSVCALSFGPLKGITIGGMNLFNFCDFFTSNLAILIGALLVVTYVGWKMKKEDVRNEFTNQGSLRFNGRIFGFVYFLLRYLAPVAILIIFLSNFIHG